jgi:hypothetical protein
MFKKNLLLIILLNVSGFAVAQILGGGTQFSNAVIFNQSWLTGCPSGGTSFSNQVAFEPTTTLDPCAPAPNCVTPGGSNQSASDVWFSFFAQATTASIVVNPSASFDADIQVFSGSACPGLTQIACGAVAGINGSEILNLTGLTINQLYYFRVFGFGNPAARTGTYTFCGSAGLGSTVLAVEISSFNGVKQNDKAVLNWTTASESNNAYFEIERSNNGINYEAAVRVAGAGTTSQISRYSFTDFAPLSAVNTYYRLKEVSFDGSYKYSAVIVIRPDNKMQKALTVLNNPVTGKLNIRISSDVATNIKLTIINNAGQIVYQQNGTVVKGDNIFILTGTSSGKWSKGIYILQAIINSETLNAKFISAE